MSYCSDHRATRLVAALAVFCVAVLALGACGSDSETRATPSFAKATGLPSAPTPAAKVVAADQWGLIRTKDYSGTPISWAIRTTSLTKGKAGDLKDVRFDVGGIDPATIVPYYLGYDYVTVSGTKGDSPNQRFTPLASSGDSSGLANAQINPDEMRCPVKPSDVFSAPGNGYVIHDCVLVVSTGKAAPAFLEYVDNRGAPKGIRFVVPTR